MLIFATGGCNDIFLLVVVFIQPRRPAVTTLWILILFLVLNAHLHQSFSWCPGGFAIQSVLHHGRTQSTNGVSLHVYSVYPLWLCSLYILSVANPILLIFQDSLNCRTSWQLLTHSAKMNNRQFIFMTAHDISSYGNIACFDCLTAIILVIFWFNTQSKTRGEQGQGNQTARSVCNSLKNE